MKSYEYSMAVRETPDLSPTERLLLLVLATYVSAKGTAYPAIPTLQAGTGLGRSTVLRLIAKLTKQGTILKAKRGNGNAYRLVLAVEESWTAGLRVPERDRPAKRQRRSRSETKGVPQRDSEGPRAGPELSNEPSSEPSNGTTPLPPEGEWSEDQVVFFLTDMGEHVVEAAAAVEKGNPAHHRLHKYMCDGRNDTQLIDGSTRGFYKGRDARYRTIPASLQEASRRYKEAHHEH